MLDIEDKLRLLDYVEEKYPVHNWSISGIRIWPYIVSTLGGVLEENGTGGIDRKTIIRKKLIRISNTIFDCIKSRLYDSKKCQRLEKADVLLLGPTVTRVRKTPTGEFVDDKLDGIKDTLESEGIKVCRLERMGEERGRFPRYSESYIIDWLMLKTYVKILMFKTIPNGMEWRDYDLMLAELKRKDINISALRKGKVVHKIMYLLHLSYEFEKILKKVKPKMIFLICWYSTSSMAMCIAANRLGINIVEVQHGVLDYLLYKKRRGTIKYYNLLPKYLWLWDKDEYEYRLKWDEKNFKPIYGGHSSDLLWNENSVLTRYYQKKYERESSNGNVAILVTLQNGIECPSWLADFINQKTEFEWWIRMHPAIDDVQLNFIKKIHVRENVKITSATDYPIEVLIKNVAMHITMHSSVVLDALAFNNRYSIVLNPVAKVYFERELIRGVVYYADTPYDLLDKINMIKMKNVCRRNDKIGQRAKAALKECLQLAEYTNRIGRLNDEAGK